MALTNAAAELDPCKQLCEQLVEIGPSMTGHTWLLTKVLSGQSRRETSGRTAQNDQVFLLIDSPAFALEPVLDSDSVAVNPTLRLRAEARCRIVNGETSQEMGEQRVRFGAEFSVKILYLGSE